MRPARNVLAEKRAAHEQREDERKRRHRLEMDLLLLRIELTTEENCDISNERDKVGIAFGGELEYADEMTLARSLQNRLPVESYVGSR